MNLVGYSDSENSDNEDIKDTRPTIATKPASKPTSKPAFQKVVDRANPHKIRVNLPSAAEVDSQTTTNAVDDVRPAKKQRTGGGFNALLPAPKRSGQAATVGEAGAKKTLGLGRGVSLKTGAQPAFSRADVDEPARQEVTTAAGNTGPSGTQLDEQGTNESFPKYDQVKLTGNPTMFRPLSVTAKNKKKKKIAAEIIAASACSAPPEATQVKEDSGNDITNHEPVKPRVSLFSLGGQVSAPDLPQGFGQDVVENDNPYMRTDPEQNYQPEPRGADPNDSTVTSQIHNNGTSTHSHSLTSIAADLNLTAAEKRRLFGRNASQSSNMNSQAINVVNFNMDDEYAANEAARISGEAAAAVQQNRGVRAIAPGKHSLKQLLNAATGQKEELEDSFAQGRRNKKEAGNKYGWT